MTALDDDDDLLHWAVDAEMYGTFCLGVLVLSIERGDAKLPIEPQAWENTLTALEWMLTKHLEGPIYRVPPYLPEDLERVRRIHALGTEALAGRERSPELGPLADACLSLMISRWRTLSSKFPACYPVPEDYEDTLERGASAAP